MLLTAFISVFMSFSTIKGQSDPVNTLVEAIAKHNVYEFGKLGYTGLKSKQYDRYLELCELASNEELLTLTGHKNVVVRIYAFQALKQRNAAIPAEVISKYQRDHTMVKIINGCEAFVVSVQKLTVGEGEPKENKTRIKIQGAPNRR